METLPPETIDEIGSHLSPEDLLHLSQTQKRIYQSLTTRLLTERWYYRPRGYYKSVYFSGTGPHQQINALKPYDTEITNIILGALWQMPRPVSVGKNYADVYRRCDDGSGIKIQIPPCDLVRYLQTDRCFDPRIHPETVTDYKNAREILAATNPQWLLEVVYRTSFETVELLPRGCQTGL
jgi:hypothetical protein